MCVSGCLEQGVEADSPDRCMQWRMGNLFYFLNGYSKTSIVQHHLLICLQQLNGVRICLKNTEVEAVKSRNPQSVCKQPSYEIWHSTSTNCLKSTKSRFWLSNPPLAGIISHLESSWQPKFSHWLKVFGDVSFYFWRKKVGRNKSWFCGSFKQFLGHIF